MEQLLVNLNTLNVARQKRQQVDKAGRTDLHERMDTHGESVGGDYRRILDPLPTTDSDSIWYNHLTDRSWIGTDSDSMWHSHFADRSEDSFDLMPTNGQCVKDYDEGGVWTDPSPSDQRLVTCNCRKPSWIIRGIAMPLHHCVARSHANVVPATSSWVYCEGAGATFSHQPSYKKGKAHELFYLLTDIDCVTGCMVFHGTLMLMDIDADHCCVKIGSNDFIFRF